MRVLTTCTVIALLTGCASMGGNDGNFRHIGTIERVAKLPIPADPPKVLMAFGAIGGAIYGASLNSTNLTNAYTIATIEGESVYAVTDVEFVEGECIEVIPSKDAVRSLRYGEGYSRLVRSDRCAPGITSKAKQKPSE